jgi:two-component system LytT family response regulator
VNFCTAYPDHALHAFDAGALDYVLKPVEPARLQKALDRAASREARQRFETEVRLQRESVERGFSRLPIQTRQGVVLLDPAQISHATLDGELVTVHSAQGEFLTDFSLNELQARLPPERFERVHRRALLNLEHVARLEPLDTGGYLAHTARGAAIEVSRQSARELRKRLGLR